MRGHPGTDIGLHRVAESIDGWLALERDRAVVHDVVSERPRGKGLGITE